MTDYDPQIADFMARLQAAWGQWPDLGARPYAEQRQAAEQVRAPWRAGGPVMARRTDHQVPGPDRCVRVRVFEPELSHPARPALVYLHGGGFTTFSLDTHDRIMREYAARAEVVVVGVDYALPPRRNSRRP